MGVKHARGHDGKRVRSTTKGVVLCVFGRQRRPPRTRNDVSGRATEPTNPRFPCSTDRHPRRRRRRRRRQTQSLVFFFFAFSPSSCCVVFFFFYSSSSCSFYFILAQVSLCLSVFSLNVVYSLESSGMMDHFSRCTSRKESRGCCCWCSSGFATSLLLLLLLLHFFFGTLASTAAVVVVVVSALTPSERGEMISPERRKNNPRQWICLSGRRRW